MSTNYYLRPTGACETQCSNWVHLGKSSAGWTFTFRAYPAGAPETAWATAFAVDDFATWCKLLYSGGTVYDEYGCETPPADLLALIENKRGGRNGMYGSDFRDGAGNRFCSAEFS